MNIHINTLTFIMYSIRIYISFQSEYIYIRILHNICICIFVIYALCIYISLIQFRQELDFGKDKGTRDWQGI